MAQQGDFTGYRTTIGRNALVTPEDFDGFTLPAPTGGLNLNDPIDNMPPNDALELENVYPDGRSTPVRNGFSAFSTVAAGFAIRSSETFTKTDGTQVSVCTINNKIYSVDSSGVATDVTGGTTPTSNDWSIDSFGGKMFLCNGQDTMQVFNGTSVSDSDFTGVTLSTLASSFSYKERGYFIPVNSTSVWYGSSQAVGASALNQFPLQYVLRKGGYILFGGSWTYQTSLSAIELWYVCSSEGELLFYAGLYPGDITTPWGLVARFNIGKVVGRRAHVRVNNDVWIISNQGIIPVSSLFAGGDITPIDAALSGVGRKINSFISQQFAAVGFNHLWHGVHWPQGRRVFICVPISATDTVLLVFNTESPAWTKYSFITAGGAIALSVARGLIYWGTALGKLNLGESGDADGTDGIAYNARLAFSFFGNRNSFKVFRDIRPLMLAARGTAIGLGIDTDFRRNASIPVVTTSPGSFTPWGSPWGSPWSGGVEYIYERKSLAGQGNCGAVRLSGIVNGSPIEFNAFEVRFTKGGQV